MNKALLRFTICAMVLAAAVWFSATAAAGPKPPVPQPAVEVTPPEAPEPEIVPDAEPAKVKELAEKYGVPAEEVATMRGGGMGWGEIGIAISLAQKITGATDPPGAIGAALDSVLTSRQSGMGWGEIAKANGFKLGDVMGKGHAKKDALLPGEPGDTGTILPDAGAKPDKSERPSAISKPERPEKPEKLDKPERPEKPEKPEKPDKPERPEKPDKPEKPEKPDKPDKPGKP